jgi:hypothetical protein
MKNKIVICIVGLLIALSNQADAKPVKTEQIGGIINGKQYLRLVEGNKPISDNQIYYIPCSKIDCDKTYQTIYANFANYRNYQNTWMYRTMTSPIVTEISQQAIKGDKYLEYKFSEFSSISKSVRTDFDGNYSLKCPTSKCLVYSNGIAGSALAYWVEIAETDLKLDLANSNIIYDFDINKVYE